MPITRRTFLARTALVAGAFAAWGLSGERLRWLVSGALAPAPVGPLRESAAEVLRLTVVALLDDRVETGHYVARFRWRAEHVSGARALYERFERAMDRAARAAGETSFRAARPETRRRLLEAVRLEGGATRVRRTLLDRDALRFARWVTRDVFECFAATDAWVLAGYDAWPGMPRAIARVAKPAKPDGPGGAS